MLDTSVKEINVRDQIWSVNTTTGAFTGPRGSGVLIGIIDTGIDFTNEVFMAAGSMNTTRILRVWDMGIAPHDGIGSPDVSLIQNGFTYGVEYTNAHIDAVLQNTAGAKPVRHLDCVGHGTHVASIAAGDGRIPRGKKKFEFVGVAPAAELIVVKMAHRISAGCDGGE
jgi:subtilisin family serine protease